MKNLIYRILNVCLIVAIIFVYNQQVKGLPQESTTENTLQYKDGSYKGTGTGFGGDIVVNVTIKDHQISNIEVLEANDEDPAYLKQGKLIIDDILDKQSVDVDTISGATFSSTGILDAVKQALGEAYE